MLVLSIDEVRPGTKLAMGVVHPQHRDQELLRAGFCLDEAVIDRLKGLGIHQVFIEFPGLDDLDKYLDPYLGPERQTVYQGVKTAIATAERQSGPVAPYSKYYTATREFIKLLITRAENRAMLDLLNTNGGDGGEEVAHATTVAHLAMVIGLRMEPFLIRERPRLSTEKARDVTNLGVAGMLHDVGKCRMRDELRKRSVVSPPATADEKAEWESHPQAGYDIIRDYVEATTAAAVLHHHQRYDGKGFPARERSGTTTTIAGAAIHPFARILAAADLFERLTIAEDGRRRTNHEVIALMEAKHASWLDPEVLLTLPQVLPPFSPGRRVTLNDGTRAIVVGFNPRLPYLPHVKRIQLDTFQLDETVIDLRDHPELSITEIDGRPLTAASPGQKDRAVTAAA